MLWTKNKKVKSYNVIIIPDKGGTAKYLNLRAILLKGVVIIFVVLSSTSLFYNYLLIDRTKKENEQVRQISRQEMLTLEKTKEYVKSLERDNAEKDQKIKYYKIYEKSIKDKVKQLEELEKEVQARLRQSGLLEGMNMQKEANDQEIYEVMPLSYTEGEPFSLELLDERIKALEDLKEQLDVLLEKDAYKPSILPCKGRRTSEFGQRENPFGSSLSEGHTGMDIANNYGTPIHSTAKGKVTYARYQNGYGNIIYIDHGNHLVSLYGHACKLCVKEGDVVEKGDVIALMGSTGRSTGSHVHFEIRKDGIAVNPLSILK